MKIAEISSLNSRLNERAIRMEKLEKENQELEHNVQKLNEEIVSLK